MTEEQQKLIDIEKAKRKELSRVRIFWLLIGLSVALVVYIIIQALLLAQS